LGPSTGVLQGTKVVMVEVTVTGPCGGGGGTTVGGGGGGWTHPPLQEVTVMVLVVYVVEKVTVPRVVIV